MDKKKTEAAIEAILFTMGEAIEVSRIAKAVELDEKETERILQDCHTV